MSRLIRRLTQINATKKGVSITLFIWVFASILLYLFIPSLKEDMTYTISKLYPDTSPSIVAQEKLHTYFPEEKGLSGMIVSENPHQNSIHPNDIIQITEAFEKIDASHIKLSQSAHHQLKSDSDAFISKNGRAFYLPVLFDAHASPEAIHQGFKEFETVFDSGDKYNFYLTGPAGEILDRSALFSNVNLNLLLTFLVIIFILLTLTFRSPIFILIPLISVGLISLITFRILNFFPYLAIDLGYSSLLMILFLIFAMVTNYSLFIFSHYQEALTIYEDKYGAMRSVMQKIMLPITYSGLTILFITLVLLLTRFGAYKNLAPFFSMTILIILIAAWTLLPALFVLFGRIAFWPNKALKIKRLDSKLWRAIGKWVSNKPTTSILVVTILFLIASTQIFNIHYEYNNIKSFPNHATSYVGYELIEKNFKKGVLAPSHMIYESEDGILNDDLNKMEITLAGEPHVSDVALTQVSDNKKAAHFTITFDAEPYSPQAMKAVDTLRRDENGVLAQTGVRGELYFTGETAKKLDYKHINTRDLIVIITGSILLVMGILIFLTRSVTISGLITGTTLLSFIVALSLGAWLIKFFFGINALNIQVPMYAFIFHIIICIDFNIFFITSYLEEKKKLPVRKAIESTISHSGRFLSYAGIISAVTFLILTTQSIGIFTSFGFIVAMGIFIDIFFFRTVLLPSLLAIFEKNSHIRLIKK